MIASAGARERRGRTEDPRTSPGDWVNRPASEYRCPERGPGGLGPAPGAALRADPLGVQGGHPALRRGARGPLQRRVPPGRSRRGGPWAAGDRSGRCPPADDPPLALRALEPVQPTPRLPDGRHKPLPRGQAPTRNSGAGRGPVLLPETNAGLARRSRPRDTPGTARPGDPLHRPPGRSEALRARATFITTALQNGASTEDVQPDVGHADPTTTMLQDRWGHTPEKIAPFLATN